MLYNGVVRNGYGEEPSITTKLLHTMRKFLVSLFQIVPVLLLLLSFQNGFAQSSLKLTDFAIWAGSAPATSYTNAQGVFVRNSAIIQGNVGSNHVLDFKNDVTITGNLHSGNL